MQLFCATGFSFFGWNAIAVGILNPGQIEIEKGGVKRRSLPSEAKQGRNVSLRRISINLLVVYRESVNLIGYLTRRLSADSLRL